MYVRLYLYAGAAFLLSLLLFSFLWWQTDTISFVEAVRLWWGEPDATDRLFRLTKPLALLFPFLLYPLGIAPEYALLLQQWAAHFIGIFFLFLIYRRLDLSERQAMGAVAIYCGCQPVAVYGLAMLVDSLGWMCVFIGVYLTLRLDTKADKRPVDDTLLGLYFGAAFFVKESILVAGLFAFLHILMQNEMPLAKLRRYIAIATGFLFSLSLGLGFTQAYFGYNTLYWMYLNHVDSPPAFSLLGFLLQTYRTLDVYWFLVLIGLLYAYYNKHKITPAEKSIWLTGALGLLLYPLAWKYSMDRILFLFAPFWIAVAARSEPYFRQAWWGLIVVGGLLNLMSTFFIYGYQIEGLLWISNGVFIAVCAAVWIYRRLACQNDIKP